MARRRMSAAGSSRRTEAGFTAIELMVVMGVMALLSSLALPLYGTVAEAVRFRTAARGLHADLRAARGLALRGGAPVLIAFDAAGRFYGPAGGATIALPEGLALRWVPAPPAPEGGLLGFFPDGSATGGELWLAGPRHLAGIAVHPLTGHLAARAAQRPDAAEAR